MCSQNTSYRHAQCLPLEYEIHGVTSLASGYDNNLDMLLLCLTRDASLFATVQRRPSGGPGAGAVSQAIVIVSATDKQLLCVLRS